MVETTSRREETMLSIESVGPAVRLDADTMEVVLGPSFELLAGAHVGELMARLSLCEQAGVRGLVLRFCAAESPRLLDVDRLDRFVTPGQAEAALAEAESLLQRLAQTRLIWMAVVERDLGGANLELALASHRIFAARGLRIGLDGAALGVIPALGGVSRLVARLGAGAALAHLLRGERIPSDVAVELGLVDDVLPEDALMLAVRQWMRRPKLPRLKALRAWARARTDVTFAKAQVDARSDVALALKARVHDAQWALVRNTLGSSASRRRLEDARCFARLTCGEQSGALRRLARVLDERAPRAGAPPRLALIGGGRVGVDLATRTLLSGGVLRLLDRDEKALLRGVRRVRDGMGRAGLEGPKLERAMGHMTHSAELSRLGRFDVVVEAIAEESVVKRRLLEQVAGRLISSGSPRSTLVTTSSTHELSRLTTGNVGKLALVGLHFGLLGDRPYAELVQGDPTGTRIIGSLLSGLGYRVVAVADVAPGLCLRLATAFIVEGLELSREGYSLSEVDQSARNWGFELGPLELLQRVGQRTFSDLVALGFDRAPRRFPAPARLEAILEAQPKARRWSRPGTPVPVERLVLRLVEEARAALQDGVVERPELADLAAVWGMGFPAYRGGPLSYAEHQGEQRVRRRLTRLAALHGPRFQPNVVL